MNKGKILVVDDDRLVLATLTHGLSQAGYEVIDADNGDDAILLAREHKPDLALLDIRMEGKTGFDVAAYLRDYCQMPFMFLSAFSDDATVAQVKELGAVAYLVKPLDIHQIVPAVEAAFSNLRSRTATLATHSADDRTVASNEPVVHEAEEPAEAVSAPPSADAESVTVAVAMGIVMHRYSLSRQQALERLRKVAGSQQISLEAHATRLIEAQETLSELGPE
ncbi:response regulator [Aquabacterium sp.]|uniref:response regulator n=1 Tax=Aquabacterium sp. TaxID=1872578 RepID=UPI0035B333DD